MVTAAAEAASHAKRQPASISAAVSAPRMVAVTGTSPLITLTLHDPQPDPPPQGNSTQFEIWSARDFPDTGSIET